MKKRIYEKGKQGFLRIGVALALVVTLISSGLLPAGAETISPKNDFFEAVNGEYLSTKDEGTGYGEWGVTNDLIDATDEKIDGIIKDLVKNKYMYEEGSVERKIVDFYLTARDSQGREKTGLQGISHLLRQIEDARNMKELSRVWATLSPYASFLPLKAEPDVDSDDARYYVNYLYVENSDYDFSSFDDKEIKAGKDYIVDVLVAYGIDKDKAAKDADGIWEYLNYTADTSNEKDDRDGTYQYKTYKEVLGLYSNLDMKGFLKIHKENLKDVAKVSQKEFIVESPHFVKALNKKYFTDDKLDLMKKVTIFMLLDGLSGDYQCLPKAFQEANLKLTNAIYSENESYDPEDQALEATKYLLEDEVAKLYTDKYFTPEMKEKASNLIRIIQRNYRQMIKNSTWMSDKTKKQAMKKVDKLVVNVGYPEGVWGNGVETANILAPEKGGDCLTNAIEYLKNGNKVKNPTNKVNKKAWPLAVTEVNAMYDCTRNSITIPAGILQEPFFYADGNLAENLGGIGATVAHEISHAFDNDGANYDAEGSYKNWWTSKDYKKMRKIQRKMVKYFGSFSMEGIPLDGEMTLPENIADLGAMECVMRLVPADQKSMEDFFVAYAKSWATKYSKESLENIMKNDEHAPDKLRVNAILSTTDAFYKTYGIVEGDGMYISPKDRVSIWH